MDVSVHLNVTVESLKARRSLHCTRNQATSPVYAIPQELKSQSMLTGNWVGRIVSVAFVCGEDLPAPQLAIEFLAGSMTSRRAAGGRVVSESNALDLHQPRESELTLSV